FQAEDGIRDRNVTGVQTCTLPILWGNKVKEGTTLYLCFEDSSTRIQNRLFEITDEASHKVNFCTENALLGGDLEERIVNFIKEKIGRASCREREKKKEVRGTEEKR